MLLRNFKINTMNVHLFYSRKKRIIVKELINLLVLGCFSTFLSMLPIFFSNAQTNPIVPPSPNAFSLTKKIAYPVSEHTGVPNISIPLYKLLSKNVSVPIELNYHASGIKVGDIASNVGLGWSLNAGGVITRVRQGRSDFGVNCDGTDVYNAIIDSDGEYSTSNILDYGAHRCDGEPDVFYFNILGRGGRFVLDRDGNPILLPFQNIKIKPAIGPIKENFWTIIDENGVEYVFGKEKGHVEETQISALRGFAFWAEGRYTSSWYLSEINDPSTNDKIYFDYYTGSNTKYVTGTVTREFHFSGYKKDTNLDYEVEIIGTKYLESIRSNNGVIKFNNSVEERLDLSGGENLQYIKIYNSFGKLIKKTLLKYEYFVSSLSISESQDKYRLKLTAVIDETATSPKVLYSFQYNEEELLPNRREGNTDHWGYYNSDVLDGKNIPTVFYDNIVWEGGNKETDPTKARANILTKITNSLGGCTEFMYETNKVTNPSNGEEMYVGGARIKKIIEWDGTDLSSTMITKYNYNKSGALFRFPSEMDYVYGYYKDAYRQKIFLRSASQQALFDLSGAHIGYSHVTKTLPNGSIEELKYHSFNDRPDILTSDFYRASRISVTSWFNELGDEYPTGPWIEESEKVMVDRVGIPNTSRFWERGLLYEKFLKTDVGEPIRKINYEYDFSVSPIASVFAIRAENPTFIVYADYSFAGVAYYGVYNFVSSLSPLKRVIQTDYNRYDINKPLITTYDYTYWENYQIKEETITYSNDQKKKTLYKFPGSYPHAENNILIKKLNDLNKISEVIEQKVTINKGEKEKVISADLIKYKEEENLIVPEKLFSFRSNDGVEDFTESNISLAGNFQYDPRYILGTTFDRYDTDGNVLGISSDDGLSSSYIYGYNNAYPIAKVINAASNEIAYTSFEDETAKGGWDFTAIHNDFSICEEQRSADFEVCLGIVDYDERMACYDYAYGIYNGCKNTINDTYTLVNDKRVTGNSSFWRGSIAKSNLPPGRYIISFWARRRVLNTPGKITGTIAVDIPNSDWNYYRLTLNNVTEVTLNIDSNTYLDELRLYPAGARMTSYTHDPLVGVTSISDENDNSIYYQYDKFGRLIYVKDHNGNIIEHYKYNYKLY